MKPEAALQAAAWTFAQQVLPPEADYAAIRVETGRNDVWTGIKNKQAGLRKGEPDARVIYKSRITFFEYKAGASVSEAQHKRHAELRRAGAEVYIVRSIATLRQIFMGLGIPLKFHALTAEQRDEMLAARAAATKKAPARKRSPRPTARQIAVWGQRP